MASVASRSGHSPVHSSHRSDGRCGAAWSLAWIHGVVGVAGVGRNPATYAEATRALRRWRSGGGSVISGWLQAWSKDHLEGCFKLIIGWTYRAFLVAMGSTQIPKVNGDETLSVVTRRALNRCARFWRRPRWRIFPS